MSLPNDLRPTCPECGSTAVEWYGSAMFRLTPDLGLEIVGELNFEPDGQAECDCGWEGERRDLVAAPGGPEL